MIKKSRSRFRGGKVKSLLRFLFVYLEDLSTRVLSFSRSGRCLKTRVRWCIKMFRLSIIFKQYDFTRYNLKCDQHLLVKRKIRRIAVKFLSWCDFAWNFKTFKDLLFGQLISSWRSTWRRWKIFCYCSFFDCSEYFSSHALLRRATSLARLNFPDKSQAFPTFNRIFEMRIISCCALNDETKQKTCSIVN